MATNEVEKYIREMRGAWHLGLFEKTFLFLFYTGAVLFFTNRVLVLEGFEAQLMIASLYGLLVFFVGLLNRAANNNIIGKIRVAFVKSDSERVLKRAAKEYEAACHAETDARARKAHPELDIENWGNYQTVLSRAADSVTEKKTNFWTLHGFFDGLGLPVRRGSFKKYLDS